MLQALFHNKLGHAIKDGSFKVIEDTLTSSVIGLLQYLPDDLFWSVLRGSCGASAETLPNSIGAILNVHFWERLSAEGTHNSKIVEPDVWIETDTYDIIIEAKKTDSAADNAQSFYQWYNEIIALNNYYERPDERKLIFLAIGGNSTLKDQEVSINGCTQTIHAGSWFDLLGGILHLRDRLGQEPAANNSTLRILDDVVSALQYHNIVHTIWFDSFRRVEIGQDARSFIMHNWAFDNRGFFDAVIGNGHKIGIESLSSIWTIK